MKAIDKISLSFTGILVVCAIIITGFVVHQKWLQPENIPELQQVENWQQLELQGWQTGPETAPVQIVEFFDYECPYCKTVQPAVQAVKQKRGSDISIAYTHFPLSGHTFAFKAAVASECAGNQEKFQSFHELLFAHQEVLGAVGYDSLAVAAGVSDIEAFKNCLKTKETAPIVQSGMDLAHELGINSIPTFIINGKLISGALPQSSLEDLIQHALEEAK